MSEKCQSPTWHTVGGKRPLRIPLASVKRLILSVLRYRLRTVGTVSSGSTVERGMPNGRHTVNQPDEGNRDADGHGRETQATVSPSQWTQRPEQQEH